MRARQNRRAGARRGGAGLYVEARLGSDVVVAEGEGVVEPAAREDDGQLPLLQPPLPPHTPTQAPNRLAVTHLPPPPRGTARGTAPARFLSLSHTHTH